MTELTFLVESPLALANVAPFFGTHDSLHLNYTASSLRLVLEYFITKIHILHTSKEDSLLFQTSDTRPRKSIKIPQLRARKVCKV